MNNNETKSSSAMLMVAWIIIGIPAAWGVTQTIEKSMALFQSAPAVAQPSAR